MPQWTDLKDIVLSERSLSYLSLDMHMFIEGSSLDRPVSGHPYYGVLCGMWTDILKGDNGYHTTLWT